MHPNGQIPAYEWNFGDVIAGHAWSTIFTYRLEKAAKGEGDKDWLKSCFQSCFEFHLVVNRKDRSGRNVFEGGSWAWIMACSTAVRASDRGYLEQADGTAWMALFARTCSKSLSNWRKPMPITRKWLSSSSSISCGSPRP